MSSIAVSPRPGASPMTTDASVADDGSSAMDAGAASDVTSSSSSSSVQWRCVLSPGDLRAVSSARVRFTCADVGARTLVLGANTGSAYVFARTRSGDGRDSESKPRFACVASPETVGAVGSARTRVVTQSVGMVKISPCGAMCALGFADGCVRVIELDGGGGGRRSGTGELVANLTTTHEGRKITAMAWSRDSRQLYAGSDRGRTSVLSCAAFVDWCEGGREGSRPAVTKKTEYVDVGSAVHDFDASTSGRNLVVSSQLSAQLIVVQGDDSGRAMNIGSKQREGAYGGCFHDYASLSVADEVEEEEFGEDEDDSFADEHVVLARPGRKLWIAKVRDGTKQGASVEIMATIKPEVPELSYAPGWDGKDESPDVLKRISKKLEFGLLHRLGPCILSTTDRAVSIIDIVSPSISKWYPLKEPGSELFSAGFIDTCVSEHRAFFLTPSEGDGSSVWCLESFKDAVALAREIAKDFSSTSEIIQALEVCRKTMCFDKDLFTRANDAADLCIDEDARSRLAFLIQWGDDVGAKLKPPAKVEDARELAKEQLAPLPEPISKPSTSEGRRLPLGKDRTTKESSVVTMAPPSNEFPKAESDGIFFYNPRGVSKLKKMDDADATKKSARVVKKRQANILDDIEENVPTVTTKQITETKFVQAKDYSTEWPTNDAEWVQCDAYDLQKWIEDVSAAKKMLLVEGEGFEHWSSYRVPILTDLTNVQLEGGDVRVDYRLALKARIERAVACANAFKDARTSLDAGPLVLCLCRWRQERVSMVKLFNRFDSGEHQAVTDQIKTRVEELLVELEKSLDAMCDELQLDTDVMKSESPVLISNQSPVKEYRVESSIEVETVKRALNDASIGDVDKALESEYTACLRQCDKSDARTIIMEGLRQALLNLVEGGQDVDIDRVDARLNLIARIGSSALGPVDVVGALSEATEDAALTQAMSPIDVAANFSAEAVSRVLANVTAFLTTEHVNDLDLRRDAADLLNPVHRHLSNPPNRAFGRFPQLQTVLDAELRGNLDAVPFVECHVGENAPEWRLKTPHEVPVAASIEDVGDWGVKMDLRRCPSCHQSLLRDDTGDLITFMCSHTFHACCVVDTLACLECCALSRGL